MKDEYLVAKIAYVVVTVLTAIGLLFGVANIEHVELRGRVAVVAAFLLMGLAIYWTNRWYMSSRGAIFGHHRLLNLKSAAWPKYHFYGGTDAHYKEYFKSYTSAPERIALVSTRHSNGNIYAVERPGRHGHIFGMLAEMGLAGRREGESIQGFTTTHGRFVSRKEALIIAASMKQRVRETSPDQLYSEDLWHTPVGGWRLPAFDYKFFDKENPRPSLERTLPTLEECSHAVPDHLIEWSEEERKVRGTALGKISELPAASVPAEDVVVVVETPAPPPAPPTVKIPEDALTLDEVFALLKEAQSIHHDMLTQVTALGPYYINRSDLVQTLESLKSLREPSANDRSTFAEDPHIYYEHILTHINDIANDVEAMSKELSARKIFFEGTQLSELSKRITLSMEELRGESYEARKEHVKDMVLRLLNVAQMHRLYLAIYYPDEKAGGIVQGRFYPKPEILVYEATVPIET